MENPYGSPETASELPRESIEELRERLRRSGVKSKDFDALALWVKVPGALLFLTGLLWALIAILSGQLWGVLLPLPGVALYVVGYGLGKFKPWAWPAAVFVLIPLFLFCSVGVIALSAAVGMAGLFTVLIPLTFGYVCWVLLSPTGRRRYRLMVDVTAREAEIKDRVRQRDRAIKAESLDGFLRDEPEGLAADRALEPPASATGGADA